jgi:hypothetical protein
MHLVLSDIDAQDLHAHLTRREAIPRDHPDAYRLRDVRGLRYGPISRIAVIGSAIDLISELEAQGEFRMCRPPFRVKGPFNAAHSVTYQPNHGARP